MTYTEEFQELLNRESEIKVTNIFILKNDNPKKMKIFPNEVGDVLLGEYFNKLRFTTANKEFVSYIPDIVDKGTLQVLPVSSIELWYEILTVRDSLNIINTDDIRVHDYKCEGNTILVDIEFIDNSHAYFLTVHKNVTAWFKNSIWFKQIEGKFKQQSSDILALTPYVDAVIYGDKCFIIQEQNFNRIFKYDEVLDNQVENSREEIGSLNFIGNSEEFMNFLHDANRYKKAMAKVISQKRLEKIKKFSALEIRKKIQEQPQLAFIQFNEDNQIIIDKKSSGAIVDILRGVINIDLITGELNGLESDEQDSEILSGD